MCYIISSKPLDPQEALTSPKNGTCVLSSATFVFSFPEEESVSVFEKHMAGSRKKKKQEREYELSSSHYNRSSPAR